ASDSWPLALVVAAMVVVLFVKRPLAPLLAGAVYVTDVPGTGLLNWSRTVTTSGAAKAVLTVALCGEPDATTMLPAAPAVLVRLKEAGVPTPVVEAVTV